jgi:hypothetical protein
MNSVLDHSQWPNGNEELAQKQAGIEAPFKYHFLKYPALLARLSLVFHFLKHGNEAPELVGEDTVKAVIRLIDRYLEPHAHRLYGVVSTNELFALTGSLLSGG